MTRRWWWLATIGACTTPAAPRAPEVVAAVAPASPERSWRPVSQLAPFAAAAPLLLTDGTVMIQNFDTEDWWRLTPDITGSYEHGTWSQRGAMPAGYSPLYAGTGVLRDGRVIVEGGEYIAGNMAFSRRGAIYDPVADAWTEVSPPPGWSVIGDASGIILADGHFMLANCCTPQAALLDDATLTWTATGGGKADINDEESWTLLPDGTVLTVDANNLGDLKLSELFDPKTGTWSSAGDTVVQITDLNPDGSGSHEVGPAILRYDGSVLATGGNGHDARYDVATKTWSTAPDLPNLGGQLDIADGPGALLPDGTVLVAASVGVFNTPTHFLEYDGTAFTEVTAPPNAGANSSYNNFMVLLPTGELLLTDFSSDVELYTPAHGVVDAAVPVILTEPALVDGATPRVPSPDLFVGRTFELEALRPNGISEGSFYGDDQQSPTNYPIVRLNYPNNHVIYCRSHTHSTRSIAPDTHGTLRFDVPATAERGAATLQIIANGIASPAVAVNVK